MSDEPLRIRRTVLFSGNVQGVGFRYTTQSLARSFQVSGFVRNLPDGRVELVAEGVGDELDRFQAAIAAALEHHIRNTSVEESPETTEFSSFRIAH